MQSRATHETSASGVSIEVGTVSYEGREFSALGSVVNHASGRVVGYVKGGALTSWEGKVIGTVWPISRWRTPRSYVSTFMFAYKAIVDGKPYHGRGCGEGMVLFLKASKV